MLKQVPNILTLCNLLCGCLGIVFATGATPVPLWSAYAILLAALFDFLDGFAARALNANSPIGKELDSLADCVTFGVLPGFIMLALMRQQVGVSQFWLAFPFALPLFAALRLAKFNVDTRQTTSFLGLPTPAMAIFVAGLAFISANAELGVRMGWLLAPGWLAMLCFFLAMIMVSELPMFALKFKSFGWQANKQQYAFLVISVLLLALLQLPALAIIILLYILLSASKYFFAQ